MPDNYTLTLFEVCEKLSKSKKTISRYIRKGLLHPKQIKSKQGTLEYRFSPEDIEAYKLAENEARQDSLDTLDTTDETSTASLLEEKKETTAGNILNESKTDETSQPTPDSTAKTGQLKNNETRQEENILSQRQTERTGQDRQDETRADRTGQAEIIDLLKETTGLLKEQLTKKDEQIQKLNATVDSLVERNREMNILLKGIQDKVLLLEKPKERKVKPAKQAETGETGEQEEKEPETIELTQPLELAEELATDDNIIEPEEEKKSFIKRLFG